MRKLLAILAIVLIPNLIQAQGNQNRRSNLYIANISPIVSQPIKPKFSYSIGAYQSISNGFCYPYYDDKKIYNFLLSITNSAMLGDVVQVDGLKFKRELLTETNINEKIIKILETNVVESIIWKPIANPPMPIKQNSESATDYHRRLYQWQNTHPHVQEIPPLPPPD